LQRIRLFGVFLKKLRAARMDYGRGTLAKNGVSSQAHLIRSNGTPKREQARSLRHRSEAP
jgi:hypothetical protein